MLEHLAPVRDRLSSVIVTTPQAVALTDALKCVSFTRAVDLRVLGVVENMSGYVCPCCGEVSNVFSTGGGKAMAEQEAVGFLGSLPVDTALVTLLDAAEHSDEEDGFGVLERYKRTSSAAVFCGIVDAVVASLAAGEQEKID